LNFNDLGGNPAISPGQLLLGLVDWRTLGYLVAAVDRGIQQSGNHDDKPDD